MKKVLLFAVTMLLSLSSYATIYLVETGSGNGTDRVWRVAGEGEMNVYLSKESETLQEYLNGQDLAAGDEIWIAGGKYDIATGITLKADGVYVGGFSGSEEDSKQRIRIDLDGNGFVEPWEFKNSTVIDGGEGNFTGVIFADNTKVDGLVVQGIAREGDTSGAVVVSKPGAELLNSIVRNNKITTNTSSWRAPAIHLTAAAHVESCLIENNRFVISGNRTTFGALTINNANAVVSNCVIRGNINSGNNNVTNTKGSGVTILAGKLRNSLIYNNEGAAAVYMNGAAASMEHCTVVHNTLKNISFGGVHAFASESVVNNSIVMENYNGVGLSNFSVSAGKTFTGSGLATQTAIPTWITGTNNYLITDAIADIFVKPTAAAGIDAVAAANWTMKSNAIAANFQIGAALDGVTADFVGNTRPVENTCLGTYEPKTFAFSAIAGANGSITGTNGDYYGTAAIALSATPVADYALANWTNEMGTVVSAEPSFTYSMPLEATTLTANFKTSYTLSVEAGVNGAVSTDKAGIYAPGAQIELIATPSEGHQFISWKDVAADTIVSKVANFTYTMPTATVTLKAFFGLAYDLTVLAGANGVASINKSGTYFEGTSVELTATPAEGYAFRDWTIGEDVISTFASFTYVTTEATVTLTANFYLPEPKVYLIQTGTAGDKAWRVAAQGEQNVTLGSTSLASWIANAELCIGDQLWLAGGTYALDATVTTKTGIAIYGGFAGSETAIADRARTDNDENGAVEPWEFANLSIIDAATIEDRNTARVITVKGKEVVVDGLVAQGGEWIKYNASGISMGAGGSRIQNLIIRNNKSVSPDKNAVWGAGLALGGDAVADGCLIENNYSEAGTANYAAGVDASGTSIIRNSVIRGNESISRDGNNYGGGGLRLINTATAVNCLIYNNKATNGSGVYLGSSGNGHAPTLQYCTIVNNLTTGSSMNALGVNLFGSTEAFIANCLIMNNLNGAGAVANIFDKSIVMYCAYDGANLGSSVKSLNVTETPEAVFIAPTKYVGTPVDEASLVANLALKNGTQFQFGAEIEEGDTDFWGVVRAMPSFVGAMENKQVALTVAAGTGGSTSSSSGNYYVGEEVELTATANSTHTFVDWTDQGSSVISTKSNFTYVMAEIATTLTANFVLGTGISTTQTGAKIYAVSGTLYVSNETPVEVMVYSYTGQKINALEASTSHALPLAAGAYIVVVSNENGRVSTPVLVK